MKLLFKLFLMMTVLSVLCSGGIIGSIWAGFRWLEAHALDNAPFELPEPSPTTLNIENISEQLREGHTVELSASEIESILWQQYDQQLTSLDIEFQKDSTIHLRASAPSSDGLFINTDLTFKFTYSDDALQTFEMDRLTIGDINAKSWLDQLINSKNFSANELDSLKSEYPEFKQSLSLIDRIIVEDQLLKLLLKTDTLSLEHPAPKPDIEE